MPRGRGRYTTRGRAQPNPRDNSHMSRSSTGSSAFSQTLQFITSVKLQELQHQSETFSNHVNDIINRASMTENDIDRVQVLLDGVKAWKGLGGLTTTEIPLDNIQLWLHQAKTDPSITTQQIQDWGDLLETHLRASVTRFDYAKLFGNLLTEWLQSGDSQATGQTTSEDSDDIEDSEPVAADKPARAEKLEQKDKIQQLIFAEKPMDTKAIEEYLEELFGSPDAKAALKAVRKHLEDVGDTMRRATVTPRDLKSWVISSLLNRDILSAEKAETLKGFLANDVILQEVASVLNMQLASIESFAWPQEGVQVEMRRHLSGKYRAYMDTEIITALLFQYLGMRWSVELKSAFCDVVDSPAWKRDAREFTREERLQRSECFKESKTDVSQSIEQQRRTEQRDLFFMTQLPGELASLSPYDEDPVVTGPTVVNVQQTLLKIVNTEIYLKQALHGQCTVVRTDLEWFGPSLPHDSILTVLRFFGMPDLWVTFMKKWLNASLSFDQGAPPKTRKRGVPIAHTLAVLCGEAVLFGVDFAVNQRASGLYLYRIYDDFWFWNHDPEVCAAAWAEMQKYASLLGFTFNMKKTGAVCVGGPIDPSLPVGTSGCQWGFLKLDAEKGRFVIDQTSVDVHIAELRRQLAATKSVFGFVNAYNKYLRFFQRNFGDPAQCFGRVHADEVIDTYSRIQKELFPMTGGSAIQSIQQMIEQRFGVKDIPNGWFYFPISRGGLEVWNPIVDFLSVRNNLKEQPNTFFELIEGDVKEYTKLFAAWQSGEGSSNSATRGFLTYPQYIEGRETRLHKWWEAYKELQKAPSASSISLSSRIDDDLGGAFLDGYQEWNAALYAEDIFRRFGTLTIVEPTLIPVGMVSVFKSSKIQWDS